MATKTLLEEIKALQYFAGLRDLKKILVEFLSTVTALETNSILIGRTTFTETEYSNGTLEVGKLYIISNVQPGDNFTNVGFIETGSYFVATGTTPSIWTNNTVIKKVENIMDIFYNDIDSNIIVEDTIYQDSAKIKITITNNKFIDPKVFVTNTEYIFVNSNVIIISPNDEKFKIEVYN
jgi:hypothetical protein